MFIIFILDHEGTVFSIASVVHVFETEIAITVIGGGLKFQSLICRFGHRASMQCRRMEIPSCMKMWL